MMFRRVDFFERVAQCAQRLGVCAIKFVLGCGQILLRFAHCRRVLPRIDPWHGERNSSVDFAGGLPRIVVTLRFDFDRANAESLGELRDALEKVHTTKHHVDLFQDKLVPQARQAFEANQFAYETGKATFLEWITAQRNLRDLEAMGQQHIADYYAALAELEAVIGADLNLFPSTKTKEAK